MSGNRSLILSSSYPILSQALQFLRIESEKTPIFHFYRPCPLLDFFISSKMADLAESMLASLPSDGEDFFQDEAGEEPAGEIADGKGRAVHILPSLSVDRDSKNVGSSRTHARLLPSDEEDIFQDEAGEEPAGEIADGKGRAVHIVHLIRPEEEEDPESFDISKNVGSSRTRARLLPSDEEDFFQDEAGEEPTGEIADGKGRTVHIVHLIRPEEEQDPESFDIRMLASVIGSEEAAKEAVVYHYTVAASGFAARLTPEQVNRLSEKPEVLGVFPDQVCQLNR